ncbi:MAG: ATP-grasp domain-containing protein [Candidatus Hermodarchaeota archaeon]
MSSVLVVGFNVRPLARSAKKAGLKVLAVDFWGDLDLIQWADEQLAVLDQQPNQRPDRPQISTADALVNGVQQLLEKAGPVDHIIASGGFDDHPEAWKRLGKLAPLAGNTTEAMINARDRQMTSKIAKKYGAALPTSFEVISHKRFRVAVNKLELPILVKPKCGSGGFHTRVLESEADLENYADRHHFSVADPILVQNLIDGTDTSVSILGNGQEAVTVSVNEQLIGLPELGKRRTKAYCGNIIPLETSPEIKDHLATVSQEISCHLGFQGSNGFDFVVDPSGTPYFMEINPRVQATIEAIELVSNVNVVSLHLQACQGHLPKDKPKIRAFCTRVIVYAQTDCEIPNLSNFPGIADIPMPGSVASRGDPVCTVNHIAATRKAALDGAWDIVKTIYNNLRPVHQIQKEENNNK